MKPPGSQDITAAKTGELKMSLHNSFKSKTAGVKRSVMKRYERVKVLKEKKKWNDGDSVFGLPKTKSGSGS